MTIKAIICDSDDTLTRTLVHDIYYESAHAAHEHLLKQDGRGHVAINFSEWKGFHHELYHSGECMFTVLGRRFNICRVALFHKFHDEMEKHDIKIDYDTQSGAALQQIKDRAIIFTDASRSWAQVRGDKIGHGLAIAARDDDMDHFERKTQSPERWLRVHRQLEEQLGHGLAPHEVVMIDDSKSVLKVARERGYKTAQCFYGFPDMAATEHADFTTQTVRDLLVNELGLIPACTWPEDGLDRTLAARLKAE